MLLPMKIHTRPLFSTCFLLICLGMGNALLAQEKEAKKLQIGVNLSSSVFKFPSSAILDVFRTQAYSPGIFARYGRHRFSGNWDFYTAFLFEFQSRAPEGFQIGYRYLIPNLLPFAELYGEFNYAYYSYVSPFQHILYLERHNLTSGVAYYVYMGNLAIGASVPFWDRFSVGGSIGYGASFTDLYYLSFNSSGTDWVRHAYFRMEVNVRVF
jgi:hypothetical protein